MDGASGLDHLAGLDHLGGFAPMAAFGGLAFLAGLAGVLTAGAFAPAAEASVPGLAAVPSGDLGSAGSVTVKVDPPPTRLSTMTRPACMSTTERTMARPRPLPLLRASLAREPL